MLESAKHVEVADLGFALGVVARPGECRELLQALAARAAPETTLRYLSSRQICKLIDTFARLDATAELPEGLLDAWIGIVRVAHAETPLMARDARLARGLAQEARRRRDVGAQVGGALGVEGGDDGREGGEARQV